MRDANHYRRHGQVLLAYRDDWRWEDHHATRDVTAAIRRVQGNGGRRRHAEPSQMDIPVARSHRVEKPIALCGPLTPRSKHQHFAEVKFDNINFTAYIHTAKRLRPLEQPLKASPPLERITSTAKSRFSSCSASERECRSGLASRGSFRGHLHPESWNPFRCVLPNLLTPGLRQVN